MLKRFAPLVFLAVVLVGVWQFENIQDWWWLRNYQPSSEIAGLADATTMTDKGRRSFYLADPKLDDKIEFNQHCPVTERSLVLGCYSNGDIYILQVTRSELAKVMNVTAAHELLHYAYEDMPKGERQKIDVLVSQFYEQTTNQSLRSLIAEYDQTQPGTRNNELHSLLGTQVRQLTPELETYYQQYFSNRSQIVSDYESYEAVFRSIESQQDELKSEINSLKQELVNLESTLDQQHAQLEATNQQMDSYRSGGDFEAYNSLVPIQNSLVRQYNNNVERYKILVTNHNVLVDQYNNLSVRQNELVQSLDARFETR